MKLSLYTALHVESPQFENNCLIPPDLTKINPELRIGRIPKAARSLALIVENTNYSEGRYVHWVVWNLVPHAIIQKNTIPGILGKNSDSKNEYLELYHNPNHFFLFKVYALNTVLDLQPGSTREELIKVMDSHIIGSGILVGRYLNMDKIEQKLKEHPLLIA